MAEEGLAARLGNGESRARGGECGGGGVNNLVAHVLSQRLLALQLLLPRSVKEEGVWRRRELCSLLFILCI